MGKKAKVKNPYIKLGGVYYEGSESATKKTVSRKVFDTIHGMYQNPSVWLQANNNEDAVFLAMAEAAVRAVRAWDLGETNTSETPSQIRNDEKISKAVKKSVRIRSGWRCELSLLNCTGFGDDYHHVIHRSQGGSSAANNIRYVCKPCHHQIHGRRFNHNASHWTKPTTNGGEVR